MANYTSEITLFLNDYLEKNPEVAAERLVNRATWWDKPQTLSEQKDWSAANVAQTAYVYFPNSSK